MFFSSFMLIIIHSVDEISSANIFTARINWKIWLHVEGIFIFVATKHFMYFHKKSTFLSLLLLLSSLSRALGFPNVFDFNATRFWDEFFLLLLCILVLAEETQMREAHFFCISFVHISCLAFACYGIIFSVFFLRCVQHRMFTEKATKKKNHKPEVYL